MRSKESQLAAQTRLKQWTLEIQECMNRPKGMTVSEWCSQHNITKANYYWRLKRVRKECLEQLEAIKSNFIELSAPVTPLQTTFLQLSESTDNTVPIAAILHVANGITIEISENATADFIKNLIGAISNA